VQPRNYLLFACHLTNATAQSLQELRYLNYWHNGGREKKLGIKNDEAAPGPVTQAILETKKEN